MKLSVFFPAFALPVYVCALSAQQPNEPHSAVRAGWKEVSEWIAKAADAVPADKYGYRPVETVRTFGQLIGHLADSYTWYCARAAGRNEQWLDAIEKGGSDKAALTSKLKQTADACGQVYAGNGNIAPLMANIAHANLHYGNIATYMRMLGLVPPSS